MVTGEPFEATFSTKTQLTWREQLRTDELRRQFLGADAQYASVRASNMADALASIAVHLVEPIPAAWKGMNGGLECRDDNVVVAIYNAIQKADNDAIAGLKKDAETAKAQLKAELEEQSK